MELSKSTQLKLNDPLSDVTRRERKYLLGLSVLGLIISKAGAVPTELSAFGVKFDSSNQESLLFIFSLIILYYLVAFSIYAMSDFLSWKLAFVHQFLESRRNKKNSTSDEFEILADKEFDTLEKMTLIMKFTGATSFLRVIFEFVLPIIFGGYAFFSLL